MYINRPTPRSRVSNMIKNASMSKAGLVGSGFKKKASVWMPGMNVVGALDASPVSRMAMKPFSPLYQESNLMLPKDRKTMNAYNRHYFESDYWVGNAIDLHTYYPLGGFEIISKDSALQKLMQKMAERIDLFELVLGVGLDYWVYGEAFPYLIWDSNDGMWSSWVLYNPDFVEVQKIPLVSQPIISLIPDSSLKRVATSTDPQDLVLRDQLPRDILEYVMMGMNIPLNPRSVTHIVRKSVPHDTRGTSIIQRVWKELMLRDAFREVLFVAAQNHVAPLKIYKIGSREKEYFPTDEELEYWRNMIEEAQNDPNFSLITHDAFDVQYIGAGGQMWDVSNYLKIIEDNVLTGLFISKAFTGSEGPTYSASVVAYEVLQKRYTYFRNLIEKWLINKVFLPVSIAHGFKTRDGSYQVPVIRWSSIDFKKDEAWRSIILQLNRDKDHQLVSDRTLLVELGLNPDEEKEQIRAEKAATIVEKEVMKQPAVEEEAGLGGLGLGGLPGLGGGGGEFGLGAGPGMEAGAPGAPPPAAPEVTEMGGVPPV